MAGRKPRLYTCIVCQGEHVQGSPNGGLPERCPDCKRDPAASGVKAQRCTHCNRNWPIGMMVSGKAWRYCKACKKEDERIYALTSPHYRAYRQSFAYKKRARERQRHYRADPAIAASISKKRRAYQRDYWLAQKANGKTSLEKRMRRKVKALKIGLKRRAIDLVLEQWGDNGDDQ